MLRNDNVNKNQRKCMRPALLQASALRRLASLAHLDPFGIFRDRDDASITAQLEALLLKEVDARLPLLSNSH
jgi:hypothetical protein